MKNWMFLIIPLLLWSCGSKTPNQTTSNPDEGSLSYWFKKSLENAGEYDPLVSEGGNGKWAVKLIAPEVDPEKSYPLVIGLHWAGALEDQKVFSSCLLEPAFSRLEAFMVIPDAENRTWREPINSARVLKLIRLAKKEWPIDENKIVVTGYSNGGNGSWFFAENYPELISASIPIASSYQTQQQIKAPLYVIHGDGDELFPLTTTQRYVELSKSQGSTVQLVIKENASHFEGCAYVPELKKAVDWLESIW